MIHISLDGLSDEALWSPSMLRLTRKNSTEIFRLLFQIQESSQNLSRNCILVKVRLRTTSQKKAAVRQVGTVIGYHY